MPPTAAPAPLGAFASGSSQVEHRSAGGAAASWRNPPVIELLRIGAGLIWLLNLVYIVDPQNGYWTTFSQTARSFAPTTIGGPGFAEFVASNPLFFSWAIALITAYLTVALLLGVTTRLACFAGAFFSAVLIATQFGSTFLFPGGTDVGAHPLYILIYAVLVIGGAGQSLSVDRWVRRAWATRGATFLPAGWPTPHRWSDTLSSRTLVTYFVAGTLLSFGVGFGLIAVLPSQGGSSEGSLPPGPVSYVNLSVSVNPANGWPQFTPANFTVPVGRITITINDQDAPMTWVACPCPVKGTIDGLEKINGTSVGLVPAVNIAHSFNIPAAGVQVFSPGLSIVQFSFDVTRTGTLLWYCIVPCGVGTDPYGTPPMGVAGYMAGSISVT